MKSQVTKEREQRERKNRWAGFISKATEIKDSTRNVTSNVFELVEAISLVTVSVYAIWAAKYHYKFDTIFATGLFLAGVVILLMGAGLLIKHLNRR